MKRTVRKENNMEQRILEELQKVWDDAQHYVACGHSANDALQWTHFNELLMFAERVTGRPIEVNNNNVEFVEE